MKYLSLNRLAFIIVFGAVLLNLIACSDSNEPSKSSEKKIISFTLNEFTPAITGIINESAKAIAVSVPLSADVTNLIPTIIISGDAIIEPASNIPQDFTNPVVYTVTAEDGSKAQYTVTVTKVDNDTDPLTLPSSMSENTTLKKRNSVIDYIIDGTFVLEGNALLTIEAGVKIVFTGVNGRLYVGENAGLKILGTADKPVIFTGPVNNPNKGSWSGITVYSNRQDNQWDYVIIENAGYGDDYALGLYHNAQLSLRNSIIRNSVKYGIYMYSDSKFNTFSNNLIENCNNAPVICWGIDQASKFDITSSFINNAMKYIEVDGYDWHENNLTINRLDVPYYIQRLTMAGAELTIQPGVHFIFGNSGYLSIHDGGKLNAKGTASQKITFSGKAEYPSGWQGIFIYSQLPSEMENCLIQHGGKDDYANLILSSARLKINDCIIKDSGNYGVIYNNECNITSSNIEFINCSNGNVYNSDDGTITETMP